MRSEGAETGSGDFEDVRLELLVVAGPRARDCLGSWRNVVRQLDVALVGEDGVEEVIGVAEIREDGICHNVQSRGDDERD